MRGVKWMAGGLLLVLLVTAGVAWWRRESLHVWWALRELGRAGDGDRAAKVERVVGLGEQAMFALVDRLADADDAACLNLLAGLNEFVRARGVADPVVPDLLTRLSRPFPRVAVAGRTQFLRDVPSWFADGAAGEELVQAVAGLLGDTDDDAELHAAALDLADLLVRQPGGKAVATAARDVARGGLRSSSATVRLKAVRLCLQPGMGLLEQLVGLLRDTSAEVRRAAMLAVGPAEDLVREDMLLPALHDSDADVRKLAEAALKARGLRPEHLEMGRLLTHPKATARLQVLDRIRTILDGGSGTAEADLDPGVWMRRLSHDASPAVRAAALRLMSQQELVDLKDRIDQMARSDPSETVCQLARYYLGQKR